MDRVSNNLLTNNFMQDVNRQQEGMARVQKQLSSQSKNLLPDDDPVGIAQYMHQRTRNNDLNRFERNITFSKGRLDLTETSLRSVTDLLQRARELAVQGANGTYTGEERKDMAFEINELLKQTIDVANTQYQGSSLFGGTSSEKQAFNIETGKIVNPLTGELSSGEDNITKVHYQGDSSGRFAEVGRGEYIQTNITGNDAFFASNQTIVSGTSGSGYVANRDQVIRIDGVEIPIKTGDNLQAVSDKINNAKLSVHASIDNSGGQNLLTLQTTNPHQIYLEDLGGGSVLQDVGLIDSAVSAPPTNYSPTAVVYENSIFDRLIQLRDSFYNNDAEGINRGIGGLDESLTSNTTQVTKIGAIQARVDGSSQRIEQQKMYTAEVISQLQDVNVPEAITNLKKWETELQASLQIGAQILPRTLLDYLR
jgi:flagellar hook-associated protein 3 FlgL